MNVYSVTVTYINVFSCFGVTVSDPRVSPPNHPKMTPIFLGWSQFFWESPQLTPKNSGMFWDVLGSIPNHRRFFLMILFFGIAWDVLGCFGNHPKVTPTKYQNIPKNPKNFGMIPKIWGDVRGYLAEPHLLCGPGPGLLFHACSGTPVPHLVPHTRAPTVRPQAPPQLESISISSGASTN